MGGLGPMHHGDRQLMGVLGPMHHGDKVRPQQVCFGAVEIARSLNSQKMKMEPRCGICVLGPTWMAWVWGTRWIRRILLSL